MILPAARKSMDPIEARLANLGLRMSDCDLCPRRCHVDRAAGNVGICGMDSQIRIASANLHFGEEPPLSGTRGSGTIFLTGCNLKCVYCQNYPISQMRHGRLVFPGELVDTMLVLQNRGAHNINFVTPTHYIAPIAEAIYNARKRGLTVPIVYNSSGYDAVEVLREIAGLIDVYLPDMRYSDSGHSQCYSSAPDYTTVNRAAVKEMFRQVGLLQTDEDGIAIRGLIIRHLVLPENISGTEETLRFIAEEISTECHISLMSQYFPAHRAETIKPLDRRVTSDEYRRASKWMRKYKLENGWCQNEEI